jgi:glycosyltransferase involved in cell wall biosynthesis
MATDAHDLTVVIPAYKAEAFIARAITSVLEQPDVRPEIIVVVDGVCDGTAEIAGRFPCVTVLVNETNQGAPGARNRGLAAATAPFVLFLDADDYVEGSLLHGLLAVAMRDDLDLGFGRGFWQLSDGRREVIAAPTSRDDMGILREWLSDRFVPPCSVLWRASFLRGIGGWKEGLVKNQDGELVWRALLAGSRVAYGQAGSGIYVQHQGQTRITAGRDAAKLRSILQTADWLISELEKKGKLDEPMRRALIGHLYGGMCQSFLWGHDDVGTEFETRWRQLGGRRHQGSWLHRVASNILGLRRKQKLSNLIRFPLSALRKINSERPMSPRVPEPEQKERGLT